MKQAIKIKVDKFGRVLIPKAVRDELGFHPNATLEGESKNGEFRLKPKETGRLVREKDGLLVWHPAGPAPKGFDLVKFIHDQRDQRTQDIIRRAIK